MKWTYGVTTVPDRFGELLPRTLASLARAGFDQPRLFIDGPGPLPGNLDTYEVTRRVPRIRTHGNWVLSAYELFIREPTAERYAIFQDDLITYPNLRQYLEACAYPKNGYWNLYTFPENDKKNPGWSLSNQLGYGALALVFSNEALRTLLSQRHLVERPLDANRGWRSVDGGIVSAMKKAGWKEYVHSPSLTQHIGHVSSMGNKEQPYAKSFRGEDFDALSLIDPARPAKVSAVHTSASRTKRIGLVGYNCNTGLGELNRQIATYGGVQAWLVKPHKHLPTNPPHPDVETILCPQGSNRHFDQFFKQVDTVVFCETPYYPNLVETAVNLRKRIVVVPMLEWMPHGAKGWPKQCSLFLCPTKQCYETFERVVKCVDFPWPIDTERFKFQLREKASRFLFLNGHGGWEGRKGASVVREAQRLWPEMPLLVRSQVSEGWPLDTEFLLETASNADLYARGDVLLAPHSVDGLGLEPLEAMACGMPVITTNGKPWNENPALGRIAATVSKRVIKRPIDWYSPDPQSLIDICKGDLGIDISKQSQEVRAWAESRSWSKKAEEFQSLVRGID